MSELDDLAGILGPPQGEDTRIVQGVIRFWEPETFENVVEVDGLRIKDVNVASGIEALTYRVDDVVLLEQWFPGGRKGELGLGTTWIRGRVVEPGNVEPGTWAERLVSFLILPGKVEWFAGPPGNVPDGWLVCDGSEVSRNDFARLFAAIGTTWGVGDGVTTFDLPDLRDRHLVGAGSAFAVGDTGGSSSHTHSNPATGSDGSHSHGSAGSHGHGGATGTNDLSAFVAPGNEPSVQLPAHNHTHSIGSDGSHSHGSAGSHTHAQGDTGSAGNLPPYAALTPIIRY